MWRTTEQYCQHNEQDEPLWWTRWDQMMKQMSPYDEPAEPIWWTRWGLIKKGRYGILMHMELDQRMIHECKGRFDCHQVQQQWTRAGRNFTGPLERHLTKNALESWHIITYIFYRASETKSRIITGCFYGLCDTGFTSYYQKHTRKSLETHY